MENTEELKDMEIVCNECGKTFIHSVRDQKFYNEMNFTAPKYCIDCRKARKARREQNEKDQNEQAA